MQSCLVSVEGAGLLNQLWSTFKTLLSIPEGCRVEPCRVELCCAGWSWPQSLVPQSQGATSRHPAGTAVAAPGDQPGGLSTAAPASPDSSSLQLLGLAQPSAAWWFADFVLNPLGRGLIC